ncbi:MAG: glycosyl transferase family 2, partial [Acetatifactor sp.]|nr:glycosyl transferase family 2 [Acetatifactor sp.]
YFTRFERVEEPLYYYYQHQTSTVHHVSEEKCRDRMKAAQLMLRQCRERGFLEKYYPEVQYRFTELYYAVTLFSYMLGCPHKRLSFVKELGQGIREAFPDFQENVYYQQFTNPEEKQMIALQMQSDMRFFYYYGLKVWVRRLKRRLRKKN